MIKILAYLIYNIFAKYLPPSYSRFNIGQKRVRAWCGRQILQSCGVDVNIERGAVFASTVRLGDRSGIGVNSIVASETCIGNDVMMGPECIIYTRNHKFEDINSTMNVQGFSEVVPVVIGDDVWLGARVIILPGVKIGTGVVVGAGAVVSRDIPDYAVVVGNPAKIVKYRNQGGAV